MPGKKKASKKERIQSPDKGPQMGSAEGAAGESEITFPASRKPDDQPDLHKRAEEILLKHHVEPDKIPPADVLRILHELQVHQIELDMQNDELRRTNLDLETARENYFDLYNLAPVGYVTINEKGIILETNLTAAALLGKNRIDLVRRPLSQFISREDQDTYYLHHKRLFETRQYQECEVRMLKGDGTRFWARLETLVVTGNNGELLPRTIISDISENKMTEEALKKSRDQMEQRIVERTAELRAANETLRVSRVAALNLMQDALLARKQSEETSEELRREVSERKRAQEELQKSEEQFRTLAESISNLAWWANGDGYITWYNRRWYEYTGTTPEQMEGWGWQSVHDPNVLPKVLERWKESLATGEPFDMEFPLRGADGVFRPFLTRIMPVKDSAGLVLRWFGTNTDISALKKAEEVQGRLAAIVESAEDAIIGKDLNGNIQTWNIGAENIFGYKAEEVIGKNVSLLVQPGQTDEVPEILARVKQGEHIEKFETVRMRKDGTIVPVSLTFSAIKDASGVIIGASKIAHDITERKRAEQAILDLNRDLAAGNSELVTANRELEAFSYSVSHDLRAPVRHISSYMELLTKNLGSQADDKAKHYMRVIIGASKKMNMLIDDLLAFSRMGRTEMKKTTVHIPGIIRDVIREMTPDIKERDVEWKIEALPDVHGDTNMLRLAIVNLISNAIKYTAPRSKAEIEIGCTEEAEEFIFFVKDNGVGFDMEFIDKLFGVFQRLHQGEEFEGTGIGLANVHRIISRHGGRTWAEGAVGQGAVFYFTIPKIKEI